MGTPPSGINTKNESMLARLRLATATFLAAMRLTALSTVAYRLTLFLSLLSWVVPLAFMALWSNAAAGSGVMTTQQTTTYYLVLFVTSNLAIGGYLLFGMGPMVQTGQLASMLMMPLSPVRTLVAGALSETLIRSVPLVVAVPLLGWALNVHIEVRYIPAAALMFMLGWVSAALAAAVYSLLALYFQKGLGIAGLFTGIEWLLAGMIAPSLFLPQAMQTVMRGSPLWAAGGGMAEVLSGATTPQWWMFAVPAAWIVGLSIAWHFGWRKALVRFEAVGL